MALALILLAVGPINRAQYLRVWLAMLAGLPLAQFLPNMWAYIVIDLAIAAIVMVQPKAMWQRAIGLCYIAMALLTTGYMIRVLAGVYFSLSPATNSEMLHSLNDVLGWAATAVLIAWGGNGVFRSYWIGPSSGRNLQTAGQGRSR